MAQRAALVYKDEFPQAIVPLADRAVVHEFVWAASVLCILVAIWTGLRIYSRTVRQMSMGLEDMLYYVSVVSLVVSLLGLIWVWILRRKS